MAAAILVLALLAGLGAAVAAPAPAAAAASNVMALTDPALSRSLSLIKSNDPELTAYLGNPNTVCTFFAGTNDAITQSIRRLGKYAGKAAQNETLQQETFNYHVVPGKALTLADLAKLKQVQTRANQTLYVMTRKGETSVYSRPEYPTVLNHTSLRAGKCTVHPIDTSLVPPSAIPLVHPWLVELGTLPPKPPREEWAPIQDAYLQTYVTADDAEKANATASKGDAAAAPAAAEPAPAAKPASGAVAAAPALVAALASAAAALLLLA